MRNDSARSRGAGTLPGALADPEVLQALFANKVDHVYLYDSQKRFRFVSREALESLGLTADEVLGKRWQELDLDTRAMEPFECELDTVLSQREPLRGSTSYPTSYGPRTFEYVMNPLDGSDGSISAVLVTVTDTSDPQLSELERSRAELESIYTHAPIGLAVFDNELRFVRVNERLAEINGFTDGFIGENSGRYVLTSADWQQRSAEASP